MLAVLILFQDKFPEDGFVLGIVLMLDLINSVARFSIFLAITPSSTDPSEACSMYFNVSSLKIVRAALQVYRNETNGNALGGIIVFSVLLLPLIVVFFVMIILYIISARQQSKTNGEVHHSPLFTLFYCGKSDIIFADHSHMSFIAGLIQSLLVTVYFISDNLGPLVETNGDDFGCSNTCARNIQVVSSILSVGAILLLNNVPYLLHHYVQASFKYEYVIENEKTLLGVIGNIVKVDAAYTALTIFTEITDSCNATNQVLNWIALITCTVGGAIYITIKIINVRKDIKTGPITLFFMLGGVIFMIALLFFYLSGDNDTPLDCGFHCDANGPSGVNMSHPLLDRHCCNIHGNIVTRLAFTLTATVQAIIVAVAVGVVIFSTGNPKGVAEMNTEKSGEDKGGISDDRSMADKKTGQESESSL